MKDKLFKLNRKKVDAVKVILACKCQDKFYFWLKEINVLAESKTFSLKKLARIFLSDHPRYYRQYEDSDLFNYDLEETIRIAKTPWFDED